MLNKILLINNFTHGDKDFDKEKNDDKNPT